MARLKEPEQRKSKNICLADRYSAGLPGIFISLLEDRKLSERVFATIGKHWPPRFLHECRAMAGTLIMAPAY